MPTPAAATLRADINSVRSFYRWAKSRELIERDPSAVLLEDAPRIHNENPRPVPRDIWLQTWTADLTDQERIVLGLGFFCGLRRSEIARLGPHNFVANDRLQFVRKGGHEHSLPWGSCIELYAQRSHDLVVDRLLFLGALTRQLETRSGASVLLDWGEIARPDQGARRTHVRPDESFVDPNLINKRLHRTLDRIGVAAHFTPHQLRHSFVTNMLEMGVSLPKVARLAAHRDIQMTMRYVDVGDDPLAALLKQHEPLAPRF